MTFWARYWLRMGKLERGSYNRGISGTHYFVPRYEIISVGESGLTRAKRVEVLEAELLR